MNEKDTTQLAHALIEEMKGTFATKDDLGNFATKDDLKNFATKDDLQNLATKDDLHSEIEGLARITQNGFAEASADRQTIKADIAEVRADFGHLTNTVEDLREAVANVPTKPDMEALLEKTYDLATLRVEHDRMKKIMQEKLNVEI